MNDIIKYLSFVLLGSEERAKYAMKIMLLCIPIAVLVANLPPVLFMAFCFAMIFVWRQMVQDIKDKF